jgi:hypothetical protein
MTNIEIWKDIPNYEGLYQVSNLGRVKSLKRKVNSPLRNNISVVRRERILKQTITLQGYNTCSLRKDNEPKLFFTHRLVALSFLSNVNHYPIINHIDSNPLNNNVDNLEWCTQSHNIKHAYDTGRKKAPIFLYEKQYGKENQAARQVRQFTLSGDFVKDWDCVTYIQNELGFNRPNICKCCRGKIPTAYGFKWSYL